MAKGRSKSSDIKKPTVKKPAFKLTVSMNSEVFTCSTDDLKAALKALAPKVIKTRVVVKIANKFSSVERIFVVRRAKLLFRNEVALDAFVKNTLLALKNG